MAEHIYTFNLPDIGEGVVEGEVIEWLKKEGDFVNKDEPVVVVMTDKATVELPSPYAGVIKKLYFKAGEISLRDRPLYDILVQGEAEQSDELKVKSLKAKVELPLLCQKEKAAVINRKPSGKVLAIPKLRKMAKDLGVDLSSLNPTGSHGEVTFHDLASYKTLATPKKIVQNSFDGDEDHPLIGIKGLMAKKMDGVHIPQFSYFEQVDATRLVQLREKSKALALDEGIKLSYMPFFIRALRFVIGEYPLLNSSIDMERGCIVTHKEINIGTAMATPHGLIVPVLKGVQHLSLNEMIHAFNELKIRAEAGKLTNADMHGATITLSNFGAVGDGRWATPMVSPPEVAILAVARITKTPVVRNDEIVIREILNLSWSFDHRVIDGELAAKISGSLSKYLKDPASLV